MHLRGVGRPGAVHSVPAGLAGPAGVCMGSRVRFIHVFYGTSRFRLIRKKNKMTPRWSNGAAIGRLGLQTIGLCPRGPTRPNAAPGCGHTWPNLFCTQPVHYILETPISTRGMRDLLCCTLLWHSCSQGGVFLAILITLFTLLSSLGVMVLKGRVKDECQCHSCYHQ